MVTDPIADMLIRIKNAYLARKKSVVIPHSKVKEAIARVLVEKKYITDLNIEQRQPQSELVIGLAYLGKRPMFTNMKRVSKPGRRTYSPVERIPKTLGGYGLTIVSTSKGIMSDTDARKQNIGGEILAQVW